MGPAFRTPRCARWSSVGCGGWLLAAGLMTGMARGQVFVVGMKTATADVTTEFHPTHLELPHQPLDERGRLGLIRELESEQGFAHRELPMGAGLTLEANGGLEPRGDAYRELLYRKGESAGPGDRVQVTALQFHPGAIVIDLNGGPYVKHRFLSHIELNGMPVAQRGPEVTGCRITLVFEGGVPELTAAEVKALLDPVVDFRAKTGEEAYADTLPSQIREAVEAHEILVGMNRRMVLAAMGEPHAKHREHLDNNDESSATYEEWIYGKPPEATQFVRFREGRVVRLEIAAIGKPVEIHDKPEIGAEEAPVLQARTIHNGDTLPALPEGDSGGHAAPPPTLRRPGDAAAPPSGVGRVKLPTDATSRTQH